MGRNGTARRLEEAARFGSETIEQAMWARVRDVIETVVEEELTAALGAGESVRVEARRGYRYGTRARTLTTSAAPARFALPRARLHQPDGTATEWQTWIVPRYQRRTRRVDHALLGVYLAGANSRRIRTALKPLLAGGRIRFATCSWTAGTRWCGWASAVPGCRSW